MLEDMAAFMRTFAPQPARSLHCGQAVVDMLRKPGPADTGPIGFGNALGGAPLYGIPVHAEQAMDAGRWELREGDRVVQSGDVTPAHDGPVFYVPGIGWLGMKARPESAK
jgi:hypothetical protein